MNIENLISILVSPRSNANLRIVSDQDRANIDDYVTVERYGKDSVPTGLTNVVLQTEDGSETYPVVDGFPVLMAPEMLVSPSVIANIEKIDLNDPRYAEAYEEMGVYNALCDEMIEKAKTSDSSDIDKLMGALTPTCSCNKEAFPDPENIWVDAKHDSLSQLEAYSYLAPLMDSTFVQLGGSGSHAVKALVAGASQAILLTPMIGEARVARYLAERFGVADKFGCVIAIGEELPFKGESVDLIYSGGCFHHMRLDFAAIELNRVLTSGGKFSGVDPWKTPLHTIGTNIIGKREKSVFCKPITPLRLSQLQNEFNDMTVIKHGPILRYLFLALEKIGVNLPIETMLKIGRMDDRIGKRIGMSNFGGSLMVAGQKS